MTADGPAHSGFRRTKWAAFGALGALAVTFFATTAPGAAQTAPPAAAGGDPGVGMASAETYKIDPRAAGLSLGITFGRSLAGHQNQVAQASSQAVDLGVIGTTLGSQGCDGSDATFPTEKQPSASQVDNRQPGSAQGVDEDEDKLPIPYHKRAFALADPVYGEAVTTAAPIAIQGVIAMSQAVARSYSGMVDGDRVAGSTVDVQQIVLPGGIVLSGLHWESVTKSTGDAVQQGTFSIGAARIGPQSLPTTNPSAVFDAANKVLGTLGIQISAPTPVVIGGAEVVPPLGISIVPNATRDAVSGAVIKGIQPVRNDLFNALIAQDCSNASPITIFDLVVGSITGAGSFGIIVGGVQSASGEAPVNQFSLGGAFGGLAAPTLNTPSVGSALTSTPGAFHAGAAGTPGTAGTPGSPAPSQPSAPHSTSTSPIAAVKPDGVRGGALAGVGAAGLGLLAAMAEADRRKMRAAQRLIPQFEE